MLDEFKHAFQRNNNAHVQLIIINVIIYLAIIVLWVLTQLSQTVGIFSFIYSQLAIPAEITAFILKPWTIITYAFVHSYSDIWHILMNMLVFYWFGKLFVEYLGSDKLIAVYVLGALAGAAAYLLLYNTIPFFQERLPMTTMVGASGAIFAIAVAAATLLPDYTFFLLLLGPVKIKYIVGFYIVLSFAGSVGSNAGGEIAHLGGALIGFVYIKQLQSGNNIGSWITTTIEWFKGLFKPSSKVRVTYRKDSSTTPDTKKSAVKPSPVSQAEIDRILDKISSGGYDSLTKDEKEKLYHASKK